MFQRPEILMTPGPTPVPPAVLSAQGLPLVYHRGPGYGEMLREITEGVAWLLGTSNDILTYTCSGTGGLECAVANAFSPGDEVIVVSIGAFGQRFEKIARAFGLQVVLLEYEWGLEAKADDLARVLGEHPNAKGVLATHSETSTGTVNDIEALAAVTRGHQAIFVVDTVSGAGGAPMLVDEWGIDIAITGSQKALGAAPGITWLSISPAAWKAYESATSPRFYWDWKTYKDSYASASPESPFTPAISTLMGIQASMRLLRAEGLDHILARHRYLAQATQSALTALGLELVTEAPERATIVTCVRAEGFDGEELVERVRQRFAIILAGGQAKFKGKIFRVGHLGFVDRLDIIKTIAAIETVLGEMGYPVKYGAGVDAAQQVFLEADATASAGDVPV